MAKRKTKTKKTTKTAAAKSRATKTKPAAKSAKKKTTTKKAAAPAKKKATAASKKKAMTTAKNKTAAASNKAKAKKKTTTKKAATTAAKTKAKKAPKTASKSKANKAAKKAAPPKAKKAKAKKAPKTKKAAKAKAAPPPPPPRRKRRPQSGLQAAFEAAMAPRDEPKRAASKLKADELAEFKRMLLLKRAQLVGDFEHLEDETLKNSRSEAAGDLSSMPIHMADMGSDNWEQEFNLVLLQNERNLLREIDDALARIKDGSYGICVATGRPIAKKRLRAKPWAKYCIEYARKKEIGHG